MKWAAFICETKSGGENLFEDGAYSVYNSCSKGKLYNHRTALASGFPSICYRYCYYFVLVDSIIRY